MTTITKERLLTIKQWRETYGPGSNVVLPAEEAEELARITLASLEAKPIGAFHIAEQQVDGTSDYIKDGEWPIDNGIIEVYAAPPVPVVPAALPENDDEDGHDIDYLEPSEVYALGRTAGWNACRAAMLHSAEPASNHEELPLDYLQGQKDGLEWAAQLAEANHPQTGDWLYDDPLELAKAIRKGPDMPEFDGPTPVTPDGWISCSERMPEDTKMLLAFSQGEIVAAYWNWVVNPIDYKKYRTFTYLSGNILDGVTHWMPLPEPPQEVNRG
ncbi:TPA: DUF551 domain-containing protein [Escherichia coli]|nr:DUF551 domain-containing protein [Escherichia coli]